MIHSMLIDAAQWIGAEVTGPDVRFTGIATDSRRVRSGNLFAALPGRYHDGHNFLEEARANGAAAALIGRPVSTSLPCLRADDTAAALGQLAAAWRSKFDLPLIGVVGSNGKTTVKEMIASVLKRHYGGDVFATQGNQNNRIGVPLNLMRLKSGHRAAVIEMGANEHGEIAELGKMARPDRVVVTNSGLDHIEGFGGRAGAARANGEIFASMDRHGLAILNADDACLDLWRLQAGSRPLLLFGFKAGADVRGSWFPKPDGGVLLIRSSRGEIECRLGLVGRHNAANALAAAAVCLALRVDPVTIAEGLAGFEPIDGRMKLKKTANGAHIIDDSYNANPSSLSAALETLASFSGKKILVLGDMAELGRESEAWHVWAGRKAKALGIDTILALGDQTRFAVKGFGTRGEHFAEATHLIKAILPLLGNDSVVLIKGSRCMALEKVVSALLQHA